MLHSHSYHFNSNKKQEREKQQIARTQQLIAIEDAGRALSPRHYTEVEDARVTWITSKKNAFYLPPRRWQPNTPKTRIVHRIASYTESAKVSQ